MIEDFSSWRDLLLSNLQIAWNYVIYNYWKHYVIITLKLRYFQVVNFSHHSRVSRFYDLHNLWLLLSFVFLKERKRKKEGRRRKKRKKETTEKIFCYKVSQSVYLSPSSHLFPLCLFVYRVRFSLWNFTITTPIFYNRWVYSLSLSLFLYIISVSLFYFSLLFLFLSYQNSWKNW